MKQIRWQKDWKWAVGQGFLYLVKENTYQIVGNDSFGTLWRLNGHENITYLTYPDGVALAHNRGWAIVHVVDEPKPVYLSELQKTPHTIHCPVDGPMTVSSPTWIGERLFINGSPPAPPTADDLLEALLKTWDAAFPLQAKLPLEAQNPVVAAARQRCQRK